MTIDPVVGFVYSMALVASGSDCCTLPNEKTNGETTCPFWIVEMRYRLGFHFPSLQASRIQTTGQEKVGSERSSKKARLLTMLAVL